MQLRESKRYTILVSGASGIVGYGVLKSLRNKGYKLIGTTIYEESPADYFADIVEIAPRTTEEGYLEWLLHTIKKYNVDMIIPSIEIDMDFWNRNRKIIELTGVCLVLNNSELINMCLDKWLFYECLRNNNLKCAIKSSLNAEKVKFEFPFVLKPRCGYGGKGFVIINNSEDYKKYKDAIGKTLLIQEYVGTDEEEYTVSGFFDKSSKLRAYIILKRKLSRQGYTEIAQVVKLDGVERLIIELAEIFKPIGPTNFQFRKHQGELKLLEINPRISSSTSIRSKFGYNESQMCIDYFLENRQIVQPFITEGKAFRYVEECYIYDSNNI